MLSPGAAAITVEFTYALTVAENLATYVQVTNPNTDATVYSKQMSATYDIMGQWSILVVLPSNRNYKGWLAMYDASGDMIHQCECLGRSRTNDDTDVYRGNTPTGECTADLMGPKTSEKDIESYGPYKYVRLEPVAGDMYEFSHRSAFRIHGGDAETDSTKTWYPLEPTNGCIRVSNDDIYLIQLYISQMNENDYYDELGYVCITEVDSDTHITTIP